MNMHKNDSARQIKAFASARVSEEKSKLYRVAFSTINSILQPSFGSLQIDLLEDGLSEVKPSTYSGYIKANVAVNTDTGIKRVVVNASVSDSNITIKNSDKLVSRVSEQLSFLKGSNENKLDEIRDKSLERIANVQAKLIEDSKISELIDNGMTVEAATNKIKGKKDSSSEYVMPESEMSHSLYSHPTEVFSYNKSSLPSMVVGDILRVGGYKYRIDGEEPTLSATPNTGGRWIFVLVK